LKLILKKNLILIKESRFWPRDSSSKELRQIGVDYGRSHYLFLDNKSEIAQSVHKYCYRREGKITNEERKEFFQKLGITDPSAPDLCDQVTPTRGCIITRVKFELIKNWFEENGFQEKSEGLALRSLFLSTQHPLRFIKYKIFDSLKIKFPQENIVFSLFQSSICLLNQKPFLQVTFINYLPNTGSWQVMYPLPKNNTKNISAVFRLNLEDLTDCGSVFYPDIQKQNDQLSDEERKNFFGVYISENQTLLRYCDTTPTW